MSACGSPPGTGLGPSIFPTNAIYTTFDVSYITLQNECLPSLVVYYDYSGGEITRVELTYTDDLDPIWLGETLKGHRFNIQQAAFELVYRDTEPGDQTANELKTIELFGLTTDNLAIDSSGYDIYTCNNGQLIFIGAIS